MDLGIVIKRDVDPGTYLFTDLFQGFENVRPVRATFGAKTRVILSSIKVILSIHRGYMHIDDKSGNLYVSYSYFKSADERYIYLDLIHELVHIRQFREGKELFDERYDYVDRPTEIEAYQTAIKEARRIGFDGGDLIEYLKVDWVSESDFRRFLRTLGIDA